jgi:beta-galactosidase
MYLGPDHPSSTDCKEFSIPAFNGLAQVIVQSTETASEITLDCLSDGLKTGHVRISGR